MDDDLLFETPTQKLHFAKEGKEGQLWGVLLEKAFAKVKGTYEHTDGGFVTNGLRTLIGAPVFYYAISEGSVNANATLLFSTLTAADQLKYIMALGTDGTSDQELNSCGIAMAHAYSLISVFSMTNATDTINMYMIRNPWGFTYYNGKWNSADDRWTPELIAQVPNGVDPTTSNTDGIFFVEFEDIIKCFHSLNIAHYRDNEGYKDTWYDVENELGSPFVKTLTFTVPDQDGDLYLSTESYY